jgi:sulfur carrier protein
MFKIPFYFLFKLLIMVITINGQLTEVSDISGIGHILELQNIGHSQGIAVAINNTVVPRDQWAITEIKENDHILIIKATQGG